MIENLRLCQGVTHPTGPYTIDGREVPWRFQKYYQCFCTGWCKTQGLETCPPPTKAPRMERNAKEAIFGPVSDVHWNQEVSEWDAFDAWLEEGRA